MERRPEATQYCSTANITNGYDLSEKPFAFDTETFHNRVFFHAIPCPSPILEKNGEALGTCKIKKCFPRTVAPQLSRPTDDNFSRLFVSPIFGANSGKAAAKSTSPHHGGEHVTRSTRRLWTPKSSTLVRHCCCCCCAQEKSPPEATKQTTTKQNSPPSLLCSDDDYVLPLEKTPGEPIASWRRTPQQ